MWIKFLKFLKMFSFFVHVAAFFRTYRDLQSNNAQLVERLVSGKISKPQFVDAEALLAKKRDEVVEKLNHVVNML